MQVFDPNQSIEDFRNCDLPTNEQITQWFEDVLPYCDESMEKYEIRSVVFMARKLDRLLEVIEVIARDSIKHATSNPASIWDDSEFDIERAMDHAAWMLSIDHMPMELNDIYCTLQLVRNAINDSIED